MKILFLHHNMPGQFRYLAPHLVARGHDVTFVSKRDDRKMPGARHLVYKPRREPTPKIHAYIRGTEDAVLHGQEVLRICQALHQSKWIPDVIMGHPGWGETLFVKGMFPNVPLIAYGEFFFRPDGPLTTFDPAKPADLNTRCLTQMANAHLLVALENADLIWSPTRWQAQTFPDILQPRIRTIFDGVDTCHIHPVPEAKLELADGCVLTREDEVITYAVRNLEPMRGFPQFVRALPAILKARPKAHAVIGGGDEVSYGIGKDTPQPWRERMLAEVELPMDRVHFTGHLPYSKYLTQLLVSSVHVYLSYPFVLSWSFFEAMAAGCLIVGSDTAPVREVLRPGENGLSTSFWEPERIAADVIAALDNPRADDLRQAARETMIADYDLEICLGRQRDMLKEVTGREW